MALPPRKQALSKFFAPLYLVLQLLVQYEVCNFLLLIEDEQSHQEPVVVSGCLDPEATVQISLFSVSIQPQHSWSMSKFCHPNLKKVEGVSEK